MKAYKGIEVQLHAFLPSVVDGSEWSTSCSDHFTFEKESLVSIGWTSEHIWMFWKRDFLIEAETL